MERLRRCSLLVLVALLASLLPMAHVGAHPLSPATPADPIEPPPLTPHTVPPITDPHLPSLQLSIAVSPDQPQIGETVSITLTIQNYAPDPAVQPVVMLPVPLGTTAVADPDLVSPADGWRCHCLVHVQWQWCCSSIQRCAARCTHSP